ncbi:MAG: hypothetical protein R3C11_29200 [Planctomycetaceae bacterium]
MYSLSRLNQRSGQWQPVLQVPEISMSDDDVVWRAPLKTWPFPRHGERHPLTPLSAEEELNQKKVASVALFPVRKLISPRPWKHAMVGAFLFVLSGLILLAGLHLEAHPEQFGPGFLKLFQFDTGRAVNYFCGGLMTLAGEIAFLIWWARSRSLHDYNGNYRVWAWAATFGVVFGFCLLTEAHVAFSLTIFWLWNLDFWKQDVLCWLAPSLVITGGLFWPLRHDMFDCKTSRSLFAFASGCWVIIAFMQLGFEFPGTQNQQAARAAVGMLGALSFYMSMLMHARFVLYETAEAPVVIQNPSLVKRTLGASTAAVANLFGKLKQLKPKRKKPKAEKKTAERKKVAKPEAAKSSSNSTEEEESNEAAPKKKLRFRLKSDSASHDDSAPQWEEVDDSSDDDDDEDGTLDHLSRKERKKLKRLQRRRAS